MHLSHSTTVVCKNLMTDVISNALECQQNTRFNGMDMTHGKLDVLYEAFSMVTNLLTFKQGLGKSTEYCVLNISDIQHLLSLFQICLEINNPLSVYFTTAHTVQCTLIRLLYQSLHKNANLHQLHFLNNNVGYV